MAKKRSAKKPTDKGARPSAATPRKGDRWRAYTQFVDLIGPRLTLAEREVWHIMLRQSEKWICETTARTLAAAANIDKGTASSAFATLEAAGLIWTIRKSSDRSEPSRYGLHPFPEECLAKLLKLEARK